jgi:uncharacterized membrane protein
MSKYTGTAFAAAVSALVVVFMILWIEHNIDMAVKYELQLEVAVLITAMCIACLGAGIGIGIGIGSKDG